MRISVRLFASLRDGRFDEREMDVPEASVVGDLSASIGVRPEEMAVIFVNNRHAEPESALHEGDRLAIFPPVGGG
ncbi:MAG: MoaD/ThiS family protein [Spirochaetota bacterium]